MASAPVTEQGSRAGSSSTSSSDEMQVVSLTLAGKGVGMGGASILNSVIQSPDAQTGVGRGNPRRRLCLACRGVGRGSTSGSVAQGGVGRGGTSSPAVLRGVGRGASITVGVVAAAEIPSTDRSPDSERRPAPPLVEVKVRTDGSRVGFICEFPDCVWYCSECSRNYHNFASLTQHLRRAHDVVSFVTCCRQCRELFSNRRSYNNHVGSCRMAGADDRTHVCPVCGDSFALELSLQLHDGCCQPAEDSSFQETV